MDQKFSQVDVAENHSVENIPKPRLLNYFSIALAVMALSGPFYYFDDVGCIQCFLVSISCVMMFVVFCFYRGKRWAYWMIVLGCVHVYVQFWKYGFSSNTQKFVLLVEAVLALMILCWLFRPDVRKYFR